MKLYLEDKEGMIIVVCGDILFIIKEILVILIVYYEDVNV